MSGGRQHTAARARWWQASAAATMLQLAILAGLLVFVIDSLSMSSVSSRLIGRDLQPPRTQAGDASDAETFDVSLALSDLEKITRTPHSLNDIRSIGVRDFLRTTIEDIVAGSEATFDDPVRNGTVAEFSAKGWSVYWEDSSLLVRVAGTSGRREALLVQAHYDAVPMSHGAFDDGVGVVTCLGLLRSLSKRPTRHPVIINIDWGEESGLVGAIMFSRFHAWAEDVRAYINLEAGGVGGRAMVFRASHPLLLSAYKKAVRRPCASLIGNNAFRLGVVQSDTDYSVYTTRYGVPGLDMAFTDRRSLYHTARDSVSSAATSDSIRSMGTATLATARLISNDADILTLIPRSSRLPTRPQAAQATSARPGARRLQAASEEFGARRATVRVEALQHVVVQEPPAAKDNAVQDAVFYDILQRAMVVRSYSAEAAINVITAIVGIAALIASQLPFARPLPAPADPVDWSGATLVERLVLQLGRGGFFGSVADGLFALVAAYFAALLASLGLTGLLISLIAPRMAYTHVLLHTLLLLASAAAASTYVLAAWTCRSRRADASTTIWYSWCLLRCLVLLAVVAPLNSIGIGLFYREQIYTWAAIAAAVLTAFIDPYTGLGQRWRRATLLRSAPASSEEHRQPLLDSEQAEPADSLADDADSADRGLVGPSSSSRIIGRVVGAASALRMVLGVLAPLVIGMDTMIRQLVIFKDHLVDGSPPIACTAIAALDLATFVLFLAPYVVGIISDADSYWLVGVASRSLAPCVERLATLQQAQGRRAATNPSSSAAAGTASPHARSQISLHTSHARESQDYEGVQSPMDQYIDSGDNSGYDAYDNERIIVLGSARDQPGEAQSTAAQEAASRESMDSEDDELGSRSHRADAIAVARKGEPPETVGLRMIYGWIAIYIALWVVAQLLALGGESYGESANPLKVRTFQTTRVSRACLQDALGKDADSAGCVHTRLALSSPDSHGLARLVRSAAPNNTAYACYTQSTRDFYTCNLVEKGPADDRAGSSDSADNSGGAPWAAHSAINVTSITHLASPAEHGTLFTVTLNFTAPETRTCFIDFGSQKGFSMQAYPNPRPALPPYPAPRPLSLPPVIGRSVLPVIERATFVNGVTGATAAVVEPIRSRHPIYSNRIFAHKRDFDANGQFTAVIQYSVPEAGATRPAGAKIELSCYFDVLDRHTPLLASVVDASPKWSVFTPARNTLSTVTLVDVEI
ncbi:hypothetical protein LPJ56_002283 [Coemansia sp. RSA 2599]|nr:hypothetical protein LPJ56_002283 [Coemansia sp. RSA 2599]